MKKPLLVSLLSLCLVSSSAVAAFVLSSEASSEVEVAAKIAPYDNFAGGSESDPGSASEEEPASIAIREAIHRPRFDIEGIGTRTASGVSSDCVHPLN